MTTYDELVLKNKDSMIVELIYSIADKTMAESYAIYTNLHTDFGCSVDGRMYCHWRGTSKKAARRLMAKFKNLLHGRIMLARTDNGTGYTRLVYRVCKEY